jgi:threonine/homoserine/homoserine lactone efflux protein
MSNLLPNLSLFLLTSIAVTIAPGPDNLQVLARGVSQGRAAGLVAALGFASGLVCHTMLAAFGVAALLRASPIAFQVIKLAGAAYLIWIGIRALRSPGIALNGAQVRQPLGTIFRQSVIGNLLNPKVTLFFMVFLPQFVDQRAAADAHGAFSGPAAQMVLLGLIFMLETLVVFSAIGLAAGTLGAWMKRRPRLGVWLDRVAGASFIGIGLRVAISRA